MQCPPTSLRCVCPETATRRPRRRTAKGWYGLSRGGTVPKPIGYDERDRSGRLASLSPPPGFHGVAIAGLPFLQKTSNKIRVCFCFKLCCASADSLGSVAMRPAMQHYLSKSPQQQHFALFVPSCNCMRQIAHTIPCMRTAISFTVAATLLQQVRVAMYTE